MPIPVVVVGGATGTSGWWDLTLDPVILIELRDDPDEPGAAELWVTAEVGGRCYDVVLDTGGARSTLPWDEFTAGFAPAYLDDERGGGVFGPAALGTLRVVAPTIALGSIIAHDVVVDLAPPDSAVPSILGLDVLGGHCLELRPFDGTLGINSGTPADAERPLSHSSRSHPHIVVSWGAVEATALFDTGASVTVVDAGFADDHPGLFEPLRQSVSIDAAGSYAETSMAQMAACEIGGRRFAASLAVVVPIRGIQRPGDPGFDVILGVPVIRQANWIIDLSRGVWGFA